MEIWYSYLCGGVPDQMGLVYLGGGMMMLGEGNGTCSSSLAWKISWTEEPGGLQSSGSLRIRHDWATSLSLFTSTHWRRKWQPTPVFLPGESQGRRAWWAAVYGVTQSRIWLKQLSSSSSSMMMLVLHMGQSNWKLERSDTAGRQQENSNHKSLLLLPVSLLCLVWSECNRKLIGCKELTLGELWAWV